MERYYNYNIEKSNLMKGIAILMIIVHNYLHLLPPSVGENEFILNNNRFFALVYTSIQNPEYIISLFFSYFGHYGVQIFIFLSAYGLSKSYKVSLGYFKYLKRRFKKLYILYLSAIISYVIFNFISNLSFLTKDELITLLFKVLFIDQFIKGEYFSLSGPWWFFSLVAQFYLVFPLLYHLIKKYKIKIIILFITISYFYILLSPIFLKDINYMANIFAHLPEFSIGIYLAIFKVKKIRKLYVFYIILFIIASNFILYLIPLSFFIITIFFITISDFLYSIKFSRKFLIYTGEISMFLFVVNGYVRIPFLKYSIGKPYYLLLLLAVVLVFTSFFIAQGNSFIYNIINKTIKRK